MPFHVNKCLSYSPICILNNHKNILSSASFVYNFCEMLFSAFIFITQNNKFLK